MAIPQDIEEYGVAQPLPASRAAVRPMRVVMVGGVLVVTMLLAIAFLVGDSHTSPIEDVVITPEDKLSRLVVSMAENGDKLSVAEMEQRLESWRNNPDTLMDFPDNERTQMLATVNFQTSSLVDDSTLCAKKDIIINKFDQLLKKLGGEELALNISDNKISDEYKAALTAWLDSESSYRLTAQKAKEAEEGAGYAREQYEKYNTAYKDAKHTLDTISAQNAEERNGLIDERELIKEIMNMIGILQDQPGPSAKKVQNSAQLQAKINAIEAIQLKVKQPKMGQMLRQLKTSLSQFAEADEVAAILKQMLQDIEDRLRIINALSDNTQQTVDQMQAKLIEWQTKLVELSNAKDKAKAQAEAESLQRESLAGQKKASGQTVEQEHSAYKLLLPPYMKEIYVIQLIKNKILDHCKAVAAGSA